MRTIIPSTVREGAREERIFETQQSGIGQLKPGLLAVFVAGVLALLIASPALAQNFALASYDSNGNLNTGFGGDGKVITSFGSGLDGGASAVAVDSAGRVVAVGMKGTWDQRRFALARYNIDGSLDTTFGKGGKALTSFPNAATATANAVAIDQQGRIVVAGYTQENIFSSWSGRFALARYNPDGSLDLSFSNDGKVQTDFPYPSPSFDHCVAKAVAIDYSGRIVVAGYIRGFSDTAFAIARYNSDGSLDPTFNNDGQVITFFPRCPSAANAVMIDGDGKILAAGSVSGTCTGGFALARYNADGSLDNTFTGGAYNGLVTTDFSCPGTQTSEGAYAIAMQYFKGIPRIILAGFTSGDPCW